MGIINYDRVNWEDLPSTNTPRNASNFNKMDKGIKDLDEALSPLTNNPAEHLVNIGKEVDNTYNTNLIKGNNLFKGSLYTGIINEGGDYSGVNTRITNANSTTMKTFILPAGTYTFDCEGLDYCAILTKNESGTRIDDFADSWKALPFTFTTTQDAYVYISARRSDNAVISPDNYWYNLQEGSTIEPIQYNEIVVDNEKYSDTLNVGQFDSRSRVNVLKSKNLFNSNNVLNGMGISSGGTITSTADNGLFYIPVIAGKTYVFSFIDNGVSGNIVWGYTNQVPADGVSCTYNIMTNANLNGATFTPTGTQKYLCIRLNTTANNQYNAMSNIQCEKGSSPTSYEPYIVPYINVDNEEIYNQNIMNYNTSETRIGTWLGKPLYRKVVETTLPNTSANGSTATKTIAHNIANAEMVWFKDAFSKNNNETLSFPYITSAGYRVWGNASTTTIFLYNQATMLNSIKTWIVLEYTKTTD